MFLHITLADILVTIFPMTGDWDTTFWHKVAIQYNCFRTTRNVSHQLFIVNLKTKKNLFKKSNLLSHTLVWEMMERRWVAGLAACKIFKFLQTFSLTSSNYMILALALERHRAVTRPLAVARSPYRKVFSFTEKKTQQQHKMQNISLYKYNLSRTVHYIIH